MAPRRGAGRVVACGPREVRSSRRPRTWRRTHVGCHHPSWRPAWWPKRRRDPQTTRRRDLARPGVRPPSNERRPGTLWVPGLHSPRRPGRLNRRRLTKDRLGQAMCSSNQAMSFSGRWLKWSSIMSQGTSRDAVRSIVTRSWDNEAECEPPSLTKEAW